MCSRPLSEIEHGRQRTTQCSRASVPVLTPIWPCWTRNSAARPGAVPWASSLLKWPCWRGPGCNRTQSWPGLSCAGAEPTGRASPRCPASDSSTLRCWQDYAASEPTDIPCGCTDKRAACCCCCCCFCGCCRCSVGFATVNGPCKCWSSTEC